MLNKKRVGLLAGLLISLLFFMLAFGSVVVQAQEDEPTPAATESAEATAVAATPVPPTPSPPQIDPEASAVSVDFSLQMLVELAISIAVVLLAAAYGSRLIVWILKKFTRRTTSEIDEVLLDAIRPQIGWLIAAIGFQIATSRLDFITGAAKTILDNVYFILFLFVVVATAWRVGDAAVDWYVAQRGDQLNQNLVKQIFPLLK